MLEERIVFGREPFALGHPQWRNPVRISRVPQIWIVDEVREVAAAFDAIDVGTFRCHLAADRGKE
jgi:hypothetical protein